MTAPAREARLALVLALVGATLLAAIDAVVMLAVLSGPLVFFPFLAALRASAAQTAIVAVYCLALAFGLGEQSETFLEERHVVGLMLIATGGALAVILARLRSDRERGARRLATQHAVAQALVESRTVEAARPRVLEAMGAHLAFDFGAIWEVEGDRLRSTATWSPDAPRLAPISAATRELVFAKGEGFPGRAWERGKPLWIEDVAESDLPRAEVAARSKLHGAIAFPIRTASGVIGVVELFAPDRRAPETELIDAVATLGAQIGEFFERRRVESDRSRVLELERLARIDAAQARDQLEAILQGVADGVTAQGPDGALVFANDAALAVLGYETQQELIDTPVARLMDRFEVFDEHGDPFALEQLPGHRALAGEHPPPAVVRFRMLATGDERWSVVKASPIFDEQGDVAMAINIFEDISKHKRAELDQRFLSESSKALSGTLDPRETLRQVVRLAVPDIADWCVVDLAEPDGSLERVALAHEDPHQVERAEELRRRYPPNPGEEHGASQVIRSGEPELYPEIPDELLVEGAVDAKHLELLREFGFRSAMIVPLCARGDSLGAMTFVSGKSGRRFDQQSLELAEEIGRRAGAALENARLYDERSHIAKTLQRSLLPAALPEVPGVEVATRFRAMGEGNDVGGDFYDVFPNGSDWTAVIGDVCGKGAEAAALTGLARHTLRAAAMAGETPTRALTLLNEAMLRQQTDGRFCTVAYGTLRRRDSGVAIELAVGGHPLPLVLRRDGSVEEAGEHGTLLGVVDDPAVTDRSLELDRGDSLLFYTDGVTESRGPKGSLGEEGLASLVRSCAGMSADEIAGRVETAALEASGGHTRDDIAVVVMRVGQANGAAGRLGEGPNRVEETGDRRTDPASSEPPPEGAGRARDEVTMVAEGERFELRLEGSPEAARDARVRLDRLRHRLEPDLLDDLQLLVTELVTNSVRHGSPGAAGVGVVVELSEAAVRVEVTDAGGGFAPGPREDLGDLASGWGLYLVDRLATEWGTEPAGDGTCVWLELARS